MRLLIEILTIYVVYLFGTALLIWRYGKKDRAPSIVVAGVAPILFVASFVELIFLAVIGKSRQISPCPDGLSDAELLVERQRQQMFGGSPIEPHFASDWSRLYAKTVEIEAERVQAFARRVFTLA